MFSDMGEKTVISIVLQILKAIISDDDLLDSRRCLMLDGSLIFYHYSSNYWVLFGKDIYTTTHYSYNYYTKSNHKTESFKLLKGMFSWKVNIKL